MLRLKPSGTIFRNGERLLTAISAGVAGAFTIFACNIMSPELNDPIALLGATIAALAIFINAFGLAVLLFLLPWEALADPHRQA